MAGEGAKSLLTWVVDAAAARPVEGGVGKVRAPRRAEEHALRKHRAEDHHSHDGLREVHRLGWGEDDASIDGSEDDASAAVMRSSARLVTLQQVYLCRCVQAAP